MVPWLLLLALSAVVIFGIGRVSRSFEVEGVGAAVLMAAAMFGAGWILSAPLIAVHGAVATAVMGSPHPTGLVSSAGLYAWWAVDLGLQVLTNMVFLFLAALLVPGVTVRGFGGVTLAAALLCVVGVLWRGIPLPI